MSLESATTIEDLDKSNPTGDDPRSEGDNHLRLIKTVLKTMFPGSSGKGLNAALNVTEAEFNHLSGLIGNVQQQMDTLDKKLDNISNILPAPSGTTLVFYQAVAPLDWVQIVDFDSYGLRVVNGSSGGVSGGDASKDPFFLKPEDVPAHTHTTANDGSHRHGIPPGVNFRTSPDGPAAVFLRGGQDIERGYQMDEGLHSHVINANNGPTSGWSPRFLNVIVARRS
jgi:hypothetical protein